MSMASIQLKQAMDRASKLPPKVASAAPRRTTAQEEVVVIEPAFDRDWYESRYGLGGGKEPAIAHYCRSGWREGKNPCAWFSSRHYLAYYEDVATSRNNPFVHYLSFGRAEHRIPGPGLLLACTDGAITGWALNLDDPMAPEPVLLEIGGLTVTVTPDAVEAALADLGFPHNRAGFRFRLGAFGRAEIGRLLAASPDGPIAVSARMQRSGLSLLNRAGPLPRAALMAVLAQGPRAQCVGSFDGVVNGFAQGWCFDQDEPDPCPLFLRVDGQIVAQGEADRHRPDIDALHGRALCGFSLPLPVRVFDGRPHLVAVEEVVSGLRLGPEAPIILPAVRSAAQTSGLIDRLEAFLKEGEALLERFKRETPEGDVPLDSWDTAFRSSLRASAGELARQREAQKGFSFRPLVSVIMPVYRPQPAMLIEAIESVLAQTYEDWELIIADDASRDEGVLAILRRYAAAHPARIRLIAGESNLGISGNTNRALGVAGGAYIAFFDHDDLLEPEALHLFVAALQDRRYRLLYSDEDSITPEGHFILPHLKPDWDPILLAGINYICHFVMVSAELLGAVGPLDPAFDGVQDKEFLLRIAELVEDAEVAHLPRVVYHWRHHRASFSKSSGNRERLVERTIEASRRWAERRFGACAVSLAAPPELFAVQIRPGSPMAARPLISIIIPSRDRAGLVIDCLYSLLKSTSDNIEVIIVDNESRTKESTAAFGLIGRIPNARVLTCNGAFNWSAINNRAAEEAKGELLLFLNNDTVMIAEDALDQMSRIALAEGIGVVGGKLLYGNERVQHAGVVVGPGGIAGHAFVGLAAEDPGYFGYAMLTRSVSAVTGACMMVRRALFQELGGFDAVELGVALSDIDFCLKVQQSGRRNVMLATARFYHFESMSRGSDGSGANAERFQAESAAFRRKWAGMIGADPYYNPNFDPYGDPYLRVRPGGSPRGALAALQAREMRRVATPPASH